MNTNRTQGEGTNNELWPWIKGIMDDQNLNIQNAADEIDIGRATVHSIKKGKTPDHTTLARIAEWAGVPRTVVYRKASVIEPAEASDERLQLIAHKFDEIQDEEKRQKIADTVVMLIESMARQ